jgi:hypothetical protein
VNSAKPLPGNRQTKTLSGKMAPLLVCRRFFCTEEEHLRAQRETESSATMASRCYASRLFARDLPRENKYPKAARSPAIKA